MKLHNHCIFLFFVFFPVFAFASPFIMISSGGIPVLEDLRFLAIQSGESLLSLTPPLSRDEVALILQDIDADSLTPAGEAAYNRVMEAINPKPLYSRGFFSVDAHIQVGVEARIRTNPDIPWTQSVKDSPSLLAAPINFYFADRAQLFIEPSLTKRPQFYESGNAESERTNFGTNIPYDVEQGP
ncbi:MAG: hypothetical protein LBL45_04155 [Treponema sp.]|jgi:hypothetical protein|nr:hypothetical protein [Treponema sp.]